MNGLSSFDKTDKDLFVRHTDELSRLWRSKVKVTRWFQYVVHLPCSLMLLLTNVVLLHIHLSRRDAA